MRKLNLHNFLKFLKPAMSALALSMLVAVSGTQPASAQGDSGLRNSVSGQVIYQSWKLQRGDSETTLTQSALPLYLLVPIATDWEFHVSGSLSRTNVDDKVSLDQTISSLSRSQARVFRSFADHRAFASFGLVFPTGKTGYDSLEVQVTQLIADDYLNIPVKQIGEGFGLIAQVGAANEYEGWFMYGASVTYNLNGSYTYFENGDDYNPGDEVTLQVSGTAASEQGVLDVDLSFRHFFADKIDGNEVFKNGAIIAAVVRGSYRFDKVRTALTVAQIIRSKNSLQFGSSLDSEAKNSNNNKTVISGSLGYPLAESVLGSLHLGYRMLSANDLETTSPDYFGKSSIVSFGGGAEFRAPSGKYSLFGRVTISSGTADKDNPAGDIDVSGTEVVLGGRAWF